MRAACGEAASKTEDACISKNRCPIIKYKYYISHTFYVEWDSVYGMTFLENPLLFVISIEEMVLSTVMNLAD